METITDIDWRRLESSDVHGHQLEGGSRGGRDGLLSLFCDADTLW